MQCTVEINSSDDTVYRHETITNMATTAGRDKGLVIFETYCIQKKMVGALGMH
jgi:hypothetical protein